MPKQNQITLTYQLALTNEVLYLIWLALHYLDLTSKQPEIQDMGLWHFLEDNECQRTKLIKTVFSS